MVPQACPNQKATYEVPIRPQSRIHQALLDSDCIQTLIHQSLFQEKVLERCEDEVYSW